MESGSKTIRFIIVGRVDTWFTFIAVSLVGFQFLSYRIFGIYDIFMKFSLQLFGSTPNAEPLFQLDNQQIKP